MIAVPAAACVASLWPLLSTGSSGEQTDRTSPRPLRRPAWLATGLVAAGCLGLVTCELLASQRLTRESAQSRFLLRLAERDPDVKVFHAGTKRREDGAVVTAGGRVLTVVATGATLAEARDKAYRNVERIRFQGVHYRRDIGVSRGEA